MIKKMRSSSPTILSALLCVVIGLVIGFIVLFVLAYIGRNSTYNTQAQKYADGKYTKAEYKLILQALSDDETRPCPLAAQALEEKSFRGAASAAVLAAYERNREMGKEN